MKDKRPEKVADFFEAMSDVFLAASEVSIAVSKASKKYGVLKEEIRRTAAELDQEIELVEAHLYGRRMR